MSNMPVREAVGARSIISEYRKPAANGTGAA